MPRSYRLSIAVAAALAFAAPISAQEAPVGDAAVAPVSAVMPVMSLSLTQAPLFGSAVAAETLDRSFLAPLPPQMRRSQSVAMMIVGGAGLIVGSIIDGDTGTIIMVGGGIVGLVGLFQYLR